MDLARLRFGDWVMAIGAVALIVVMFIDWYEVPTLAGVIGFSAWESFAVNDVILGLAAVMAITAVVLTVAQPTAAVPLALSSLTTLVAIVALVLVAIRVIWTPDVEGVDTDRTTGAWLGLVATATLAAGCLASIRDERLPRPDKPAEARLVKP